MRCVRVSDVLAKERGKWRDSEEKAGLGKGMRGTGVRFQTCDYCLTEKIIQGDVSRKHHSGN